ncbi:MAG TPA: peptidase M23 [Tissierellales bacterium]|jgi:murein DD-endopeptidase MepM/ murein hydrolase activator NlpD|nr:peptidase M23 [Tissierellales bacterium]
MLQFGYKINYLGINKVRFGGDYWMKHGSSTLNFERIKGLFSFKNRIVRGLTAFVVVASIVGIGFASYSANESKTRAFEVYLGDEAIGIVRTEEEALKAYGDIEERLSSTYDMGVVLDKELAFQPTHAKDEELTGYGELKSNIQTRISVQVTGFSLDIDGERLGVFKSKEEVNYILDTIKKPYLPAVVDEEPAIEAVQTAEPEPQKEPATHTIQSGENFWTIAKKYDLSAMELMKANPELNPDRLKPGDIVKLLDGAASTATSATTASSPADEQVRDVVIKEVGFLEKVEIEPIETSFGSLSDPEKAIEAIMAGKEAMRTHVVEVGESYWIIARMYGTTVEALESANPELSSTKLKPGDEVKLFVPVPLLTVVTHEEVKYIADIDFETKVENDDSMYKNQKKIIVKGVKGKADVLAEEIRHNGILVDEVIIEKNILEEPKTEVVAQGTKELPKTAAVGSFVMPTRGRVSSPYGMRNGTMHKGIDLANSKGTAVYAADGGKVTFAGYKGSYGYLIEINHENGYVTRYAHNSKLLVKSGDRVYRGQQIATMGSTGRSTGSHLHFEVLINGIHKNPYSYIFR